MKLNLKGNLSEKIIHRLVKLDPVEFLGICQILKVSPLDKEGEGRPFEELWEEVCDKIDSLNRVQKRNLDVLVRAAIKDKDKEKK